MATQEEIVELGMWLSFYYGTLREFEATTDGRLKKNRAKRDQIIARWRLARGKFAQAVSELPIPPGDLTECVILQKDVIAADLKAGDIIRYRKRAKK